MLSPKKEPLWFRVAFWFAWHPWAIVVAALGLVMFGFALGRSTPIQ